MKVASLLSKLENEIGKEREETNKLVLDIHSGKVWDTTTWFIFLRWLWAKKAIKAKCIRVRNERRRNVFLGAEREREARGHLGVFILDLWTNFLDGRRKMELLGWRFHFAGPCHTTVTCLYKSSGNVTRSWSSLMVGPLLLPACPKWQKDTLEDGKKMTSNVEAFIIAI